METTKQTKNPTPKASEQIKPVGRSFQAPPEFMKTAWNIFTKMHTGIMTAKLCEGHQQINIDDLFNEDDEKNIEEIFRMLNEMGFNNACPSWIDESEWLSRKIRA